MTRTPPESPDAESRRHPSVPERRGRRRPAPTLVGRSSAEPERSSAPDQPMTTPPAAQAAPETGTSWAARFGRVIAQDGVAAIPSALFLYQADLNLSAQEVWFVSAVLAHKWGADFPRPSLNKLAAQSGVSVQWLRELRRRLELRGYLQTHEMYDSLRGQTTSGYDFGGLFAQLEAAIAAEPPPANAIQATDQPLPADPARQDSSFVARYGRVIVQAGIAAVPQALFTYQKQLQLTPQQVWFVAYILAYKWTGDLPYPSLRKMALRTGYSERQIHNIKDTLVDQQYLTLVGRVTATGAQDNNAYDFSGLFEAMTTVLRQSSADDALRAAEPTPVAANEPRRTPPLKNAMPGTLRNYSSVGGTKLQFSGTGETDGRGRNHSSVGGRNAGSVPPRNHSSDEEESDQEEPYQEEESNLRPPAKKRGRTTAPPTFSIYITALIQDYSREFGDSTHEAANVGQAHNIMREYGLNEAAFGELLKAARQRTRRAQGQQGQGFIENKMAYYFQVVRSMAAEAQPEGGAGNSHGGRA